MYESFTLHFHRHKDGGTNTLTTTADLYAKRMSLGVSEIRRENYVLDNVCIFMFKVTFTEHMKDCLALKNKKPTRSHLLYYCTSYRLNMFRALVCTSSGARDYDVDYHIGRFVLGFLCVGG
jgi:hypothetical protein